MKNSKTTGVRMKSSTVPQVTRAAVTKRRSLKGSLSVVSRSLPEFTALVRR